MTGPTEQDRRNAALRADIAARFRAESEQALALAEAALGPGWEPVCRHDLVSHAEAERCRRTGERHVPAATVYTAAKGGEKRHFMLRGGVPAVVTGYEEGFGAMLTEPDPERTVEVRGERVHPHRYGLYWAGYERGYRPASAEELAARRERREAKAEAAERAEWEASLDGNLFADLIRAEGFEPTRKGKPW